MPKGFGIQAHEIVLNFISGNNSHFVEEPELNPLAFAEQFVDPDAGRAQSAEELLARARLIVATELGKDPLLRQEMRNIFKSEALVSVLPTERGINKIDEHHPYFVRHPSLTILKASLDTHQFDVYCRISNIFKIKELLICSSLVNSSTSLLPRQNI